MPRPRDADAYAAIFMAVEGRELMLAEAGELRIKGPQVMAGYWKTGDPP